MSERWKLDKFSFVDTTDNSCLNFGLKDISRVVLQLNNYEDLLDNLQQQLAEKDKKIEEYKTEQLKFAGKVAKLVDKEVAETRHQVCEEIRKKLEDIEKSIDNNVMFYDPRYKLELKRKAVHKNVYKVLDQIEKGERK